MRQDGTRDAPALLLNHRSVRSWDPLVPMLTRSHRVIRIDLLGHGRSARPTGHGYEMPEQGRRVGADWTGSASSTPSWSAIPPAATPLLSFAAIHATVSGTIATIYST